MALRTVVLVSGINNLSDARYCAGMGVDFLGFNIDSENDKYVSPELFKELKGWVSGVNIVTESSNTSSNNNYMADSHLIKSLELLQECKSPTFLSLPLDVAVSNTSSLLSNASKIKYLIVTDNTDGFNAYKLGQLKELGSNFEVLLGFGVKADNVNELIEGNILKGIALQGSDEIRPGFKDYDELADILEAIEID